MLERALIVVIAIVTVAGCNRPSARSQPAAPTAAPHATPHCDCTKSYGSPSSTDGVQRWG